MLHLELLIVDLYFLHLPKKGIIKNTSFIFD